jgi:hypothetical protein
MVGTTEMSRVAHHYMSFQLRYYCLHYIGLDLRTAMIRIVQMNHCVFRVVAIALGFEVSPNFLSDQTDTLVTISGSDSRNPWAVETSSMSPTVAYHGLIPSHIND